MIRIEENVSLQLLNTFGIDAKARYFTEVSSTLEVQEIIQNAVYRSNKHLILGGGSNILFTKDFDGLVVKSSLTGIKVIKENNDEVYVRAFCGENWHTLVLHCLKNNWGGIENLSLIPGTTGAAPIQNIGAYGVEIKDVIDSVDGIDLSTGQLTTFTNAECHFNYRESVFKQELREKYFVSSITLRLTKNKHHINIQYGAIQEVLKQRLIDHPSINDVSDAVIAIRQSKLPDPRVIGNAGSFFKNPTVNKKVFESIMESNPSIPSYPFDNQNVKVPAGWLIEQCGWKGKRFGNVGVHPQQALVLINYGNGTGEEISQLAIKIQTSVKEKFDITLSTEVNII
ncbi:UDP-N-acetylmuramate dehydrogenase [soil metagenome]